MMGELWPPLWLSLRIAAAATLLAAALAVPLAAVVARGRFPGRAPFEAVLLIPLVLPPTVVGYLLLVVFGARGWLGRWLRAGWDYSLVFRVEGAVLAAAVVALPMLYLPAKAAFLGVDRDLEDAARSLGAGRGVVFRRVSLPLARRGVCAGLVLAFARALGEFGATVMVFGWQPGRLTLPISIYLDYETNRLAHARPAVVALTALSLLLVVLFNRFGGALTPPRWR